MRKIAFRTPAAWFALLGKDGIKLLYKQGRRKDRGHAEQFMCRMSLKVLGVAVTMLQILRKQRWADNPHCLSHHKEKSSPLVMVLNLLIFLCGVQTRSVILSERVLRVLRKMF